MSKDRRDINIPRGNDEYNAIRNSLRRRIQDYENSAPKQEVINNNYGYPGAQNVPGQTLQQNSPNSYGQVTNNAGYQQYQNQPPQKPVNQSQQQQYQGQNYQQSYQNPQQVYQTQNQQFGQINQLAYQPQTIFAQNSQAQNSYTAEQDYSSPFAAKPNTQADFTHLPPNNGSNMAAATHSNEPVMYKPKKRKSAGKTFLFLIGMIILIFGLSWCLREFVFQAYEIPSPSMEKTIMTGDMVFAEKISYKFSKPKAGDVVTFDDPLNPGRILIKRIVAIEGQEIDIINNKLYIDGQEQYEDYVNGLPTSVLRSATVTYPYVVPSGHI